MNDLDREKPITTEQDNDSTIDAADEASVPVGQPGLRERVWRLLNSVQQRGAITKPDLAKDRTRSMALLIGGAIIVVLLFIGVFSTLWVANWKIGVNSVVL